MFWFLVFGLDFSCSGLKFQFLGELSLMVCDSGLAAEVLGWCKQGICVKLVVSCIWLGWNFLVIVILLFDFVFCLFAFGFTDLRVLVFVFVILG